MPFDFDGIKEATSDAKGKMTAFSQSVITAKYRKRDQELYPGGICLALSIFFISKRKDMTFGDLVVGVYFKKLEEAENEPAFQAQVREIMGRQKLIKHGESGTEEKHFLETFVPFVEWMKELAPKYGLELTGSDTGEALSAGSVAASVMQSRSSYVLGFGGGGGGHAVAARNDGDNVAFFDPNCGSFYIPTPEFREWFCMFMFCSDYQKKYGSTFTSATFS